MHRLALFFRVIAENADEKYIPEIHAELGPKRLKITIRNSSSIPIECDSALVSYANAAGFSIYGEEGGKIILTTKVTTIAPAKLYAPAADTLFAQIVLAFFTKVGD